MNSNSACRRLESHDWIKAARGTPNTFSITTFTALARPMSNDSAPATIQPPTPALLSRNPLAWLTVFGPGAVIASVTLGSGELIFSARGGALFGYDVLFLFVVISVLKWGLVFALSRHIVLTGVHPYARMMELPGPRGWFPLMLLIIAAVTTPVWGAFLPGTLGNYTAWVTGTQDHFNGAVDYLWAMPFLVAVATLSITGGYSALERVQMVIVAAMMACAFVTLILYQPDWVELLKGGIIPRAYRYPEWLASAPDESIRKIADQNEWVEVTRYVGVIGGSGFDYLAYTSWLRDKHWGRAGIGEATATQLDEIASNRDHPARQWVRAPLVDCAISFALVVMFSAVFVASGVIVLGPEHQIPTGDNFLEMQTKFVTGIHPWLEPLYVIAAYLTMFGSSYGVFEIGVTIFREIVLAMNPELARRHHRRLKSITVAWCGICAFLILLWSFVYTGYMGGDSGILINLMTPANLFTGVLSCGLLCFILPWMDWRFLPKPLRLSKPLLLLNCVAGVIFLYLGLRGYWDSEVEGGEFFQKRWFTIGGIVTVMAVSMVIAAIRASRRGPN